MTKLYIVMSAVYKVALVDESGLVDTVILFIGSRLVGQEIGDIADLYRRDSGNRIFDGVFSDDEKSDIREGRYAVVCTRETIHPDDTIETVKKKIIRGSGSRDMVYDGIYLFGRKKEALNPTNVFQMLTQNGKLDLTKERLTQFLMNVDGVDIASIKPKETYDFDDIIALGLERNEHLVSAPIGQKFVAVESTFPYTVNPFNAVKYDPFLEKFVSELTTTTNASLLMESGDLFGNVIFVCEARSVLRKAEEKGLSGESTVKIYYPFLMDAGVISSATYDANEEKLRSESEAMIANKAWDRKVRNVDLYYDIYQGRKTEIDTAVRGLRSLYFTVHPAYSFNLPLDVVFKLIHATKEVPLIKLNPGKRQEKAYRLYADRIATNGQRIPYLNRATIFRLMKGIGKTKKVSAYCEHRLNATEVISIVIEFEGNGDVTFSTQLPTPMSVAQVDDMLREVSKPVVGAVKSYLEQSGYQMGHFSSIRDSNVEILSMDYEMQAPITKKLNLKKILPCLSSVFNVLSDDAAEGAVLRFKRVSNYNEMDSQEAFIVEMLNQGSRDIEIIQGLSSNFALSAEDAREKLVSFVNGLQVVQNAFQSRKMKIRNNPGFLTTMKREKFSTTLAIRIEGIDGIGYLDTLPIYLDSLLRLTQSPETTSVSASAIADLCKKKAVAESDAPIADKIAIAEQPQPDRGQLDIQADELVFEPAEDENRDMQDAMKNVLLGLDDDEEEEEEEEDEEMGGGSDNEDEVKRDITGMRLSNPNPFFTRLHQRQPTLFLKENTQDGFKSYSRLCPSSARRQPVILTKEEKAKIDKDHPGSYEHVIEYKTSPDAETYYYICPRYWSLRDNVSLTEAQAKSGKYGGIIDTNDKKARVKEGEAIYEFNTKYQQGTDGKYEGSHPGFLKRSKHPDGLCIPCCFSGQWNAGDQKERRESCEAGLPEAEKAPQKKKQAAATEVYIKGADKFPLEEGRYGYLPVVLQKFLHTTNRKCQISATNTNLRKDHPCLLRFGVETSRSQSFIGAVAAVYQDVAGKLLTIDEMKGKMRDALSIDLFMSLQNGNLVEVFDPDIDVDLNKYKNSKIYRSTDPAVPSEMAFFRKAARSYENFLAFLEDDDILIDYQYIWDLLCGQNPKLFEGGLNLAILELKDDDATNDISLICPTNHYASTFFDVNKRTAMILKIGNQYEPIFVLEDKGDQFGITRRYSTKYKDLLPNIKDTLELIKKSLTDKCAPLPSMPNKYEFVRNIPLGRLVYLLKLKGYSIEKQVLNYNGRVIGVEASKDGVQGFVPSYPSAPMLDLTADYTWIDSFYGLGYVKTRDFLQKLAKDMRGKVPCAPVFKMLEDGLIVGILTETNQFVPIGDPEQNVHSDGLRTINDSDFAAVDEEAITSPDVDEERVRYIRRIRLETEFYNAFRNTMRIMMGRFQHHKLRSEIDALLRNRDLLYLQKLRRVDAKLRELAESSVMFTKYKDEAIDRMAGVNVCGGEEACKKEDYCIVTDEGCKLAIPRENLITGKDNEAMYFGRMADELIRYNRIKSFVFQPKAFLSFSDLKYNLQSDEIIMLQSLLTKSYFEDLVPAPINSFTKYNTYDTAEPLETQAYASSVDAVKRVEDKKCPVPSISKLGGKWKRVFPAGAKELEFANEPASCTFDLVLTLVRYNDPDNASLTKNELKEVLLDEYVSMIKKHGDKVLAVLVAQGKVNMAKQVMAGQRTVSMMVMSDDYYATNLDIWLLAKRFNLPIVLISSTSLIENKQPLMVISGDGSQSFFFIHSPGVKPASAPRYRLVVTGEGSAKIPISMLTSEEEALIREGALDIDDFVAAFGPSKRPAVNAKKTGRKLKLVE